MKEEGYKLGHNMASQYYNLLSNILVGVHNDSDDLKDEILAISRSIAYSTAEMTKLAEKVAGKDLVDPEDPMVIAEKELFNAAESIEMAATRLAALRPRQEVEDSRVTLRPPSEILSPFLDRDWPLRTSHSTI